MKVLSVFLIIILVAVVVFAGIFNYYEKYHVEMICSEPSTDGQYTFYLYQIGAPQFTFGPVKTKITVEDKKGRVLDQHTFYLNNDGGVVSEYNVKEIRWYDDKIEIDIKGADDYQSTEYVLDLG